MEAVKSPAPSYGVSHKFKVVLVGDAYVGKTSLATNFTQGIIEENTQPTIGASFIRKTIVVDNEAIQFQIWDTAGQERYAGLVPMYVRGANVALLVYDVTDPGSFSNIAKWVDRLRMHCDLVRAVLVANKVDLPARVEHEVARAYAKANDFLFCQTSAKTGFNVEHLFEMLGAAMAEEIKKKTGTGSSTSSSGGPANKKNKRLPISNTSTSDSNRRVVLHRPGESSPDPLTTTKCCGS